MEERKASSDIKLHQKKTTQLAMEIIETEKRIKLQEKRNSKNERIRSDQKRRERLKQIEEEKRELEEDISKTGEDRDRLDQEDKDFVLTKRNLDREIRET